MVRKRWLVFGITTLANVCWTLFSTMLETTHLSGSLSVVTVCNCNIPGALSWKSFSAPLFMWCRVKGSLETWSSLVSDGVGHQGIHAMSECITCYMWIEPSPWLTEWDGSWLYLQELLCQDRPTSRAAVVVRVTNSYIQDRLTSRATRSRFGFISMLRVRLFLHRSTIITFKKLVSRNCNI